MGTRCTTLVIGGGASGTLTAYHLLQRTDQHVLLVDPASHPARGTAYATTDDQHLLNSRAIAMTVDSAHCAHFLDWARSNDLDSQPVAFLPRRRYGDYLTECLETARRANPDRYRHLPATVTRLAPDGTARLSTGQVLRADHVVLATGHAAPLTPPGLPPHPHHITNPWTPGALDAVPTDRPVLLVGTGLTAVDVTLTLTRHRRRTAPVHAISRRGLLPQAHALPHAAATTPTLTATTLRGLIRQLRAAATTATDWRAVVDGIRPHTGTLWQRLTPADRERFLRHAARWWETHRHRMAPAVAARVEDLRATGELRVHSGDVRHLDLSRYGAVVNCTGPASALHQPLVRHLVAAGTARPDPLRLGLDVTTDGTLPGHPRIHVVGPARRGQLWETTAVPEIRAQAETLADRLVNATARTPATATPARRH
jgi:uncharacterized NAD(P)/FAD-binding protein YdhS